MSYPETDIEHYTKFYKDLMAHDAALRQRLTNEGREINSLRQQLATVTQERDQWKQGHNDAVRVGLEYQRQLTIATGDLKAMTVEANMLLTENRKLEQQLAAMTQERDEAVRIATGLMELAMITDEDVKWAEIALARQKHQAGLP